MNALDIVSNLKGKGGQHVKAIWTRPVKTLKKFSDNILIAKRTEAYVRSGISYANLQDVRSGIEAGTREPVQGLPFGNWREGYVNYIIDHKDKEYIRLYPASFENLHGKTEWLLNGVPTTYEAVEPYLLANEKRVKGEERPACFTLNAENIVSIGD